MGRGDLKTEALKGDEEGGDLKTEALNPQNGFSHIFWWRLSWSESRMRHLSLWFSFSPEIFDFCAGVVDPAGILLMI